MTVGVVAEFVIQDGRSAEFEAFFQSLARDVREREPGNQVYSLMKSRSEDRKYKVLEIYSDEAALSDHRETPHYKAAASVLAKLLAARPTIEYLDGIC